MDQEIIKKVLFIRRFEEKIIEIYHTDVIKSPVHLSIGQELFSVLLANQIEKEDKIIGNYRSHALALALTTDPQLISDELFAKSTGEFGGRGGSMHLGCTETGMPWTSAIVSSGIPVAVGIAEAQKRLNKVDGGNRMVICQFGDGAMEEGVFIESINYSSLKKLPILFACEDNGLAIHSFKEARTPDNSYAKRISAYGLETRECTYENPEQLVKEVSKACKKIRFNQPQFLIVKCCRWMEHVGVGFDWDLGYRHKNVLEHWKNFDLETNPRLWGHTKNTIQEINIEVKEKVEKIIKNSYTKEDVKINSLLDFVY